MSARPDDLIRELIHESIAALSQQGLVALDVVPEIRIDRTRDPAHGDHACNIALVLAKRVGMSPRDLAQQLIDNLPAADDLKKAEIAGPGFINFFLRDGLAHTVISQILEHKDQFGRNDKGAGIKVQIEFVSANPTGPLHVGHGRGAAYGASLANLLQANGYTVQREYYVNDAGRQMDILAVSVWLRYLELAGEKLPFPVNGYQGDYVWDIGASLHREQGDAMRHPAAEVLTGLPDDESDGGDKEQYIDALIARCKSLLTKQQYAQVHAQGLLEITDNIRRDLKEFAVEYEEWFKESSLMQSGAVPRAIERLQSAGHVYEKNGALWFRSSAFGDEKDRVLRRDNGLYTYFASDIAYHMNKLERGFDRLINIWGSDHHGYVPRVRAAIEALGGKPQQLEVLLVQFAKLYRDGKQLSMSTRSGQFVTLRELREETGNDAARFFYVMRKCEQHLDFDLDLAKSQSNDNPVYYIQYAHARVCSVFRQLHDKALQWDENAGLENLALLNEPHETDLIRVLGRYADLIEKAGNSHEPHQITYYLRDVAQAFHTYYNAHTFIVDDSAMRNARLCLIAATRQLIHNGLAILGVSAPETM